MHELERIKKSHVEARSFLVVIHDFGDPESFKVRYGKVGEHLFED